MAHDEPPTYRFYGELATWWPLISPVEEYAEEAAFVAEVLRSGPSPVHEVLELGSGGGSNAWHLTRAGFSMTLVDLSPDMVAVSTALNPGVAHHVGDMRALRLGRTFDATFVHDAVDYMVDEDDLRRAVATAFAHTRPGGLGVFVPDQTTETFEPGADVDGHDAPDGRAVRFMDWTWDPDPADTWTLTEYAFLLRDLDGRVRSIHETHRLGLFSRSRWLDVLTEAGFVARSVEEVTTEDRTSRTFFVGQRPA